MSRSAPTQSFDIENAPRAAPPSFRDVEQEKRRARTLVIEFKTLLTYVREIITKRGNSKSATKGGLPQHISNQIGQHEADVDFHTIDSLVLAERLDTNLKSGLTTAEAQRRLAEWGPNALSPPPSRLLAKLANYFLGGFCWLLWIAAVLAFLAYKPIGNPNPDPTNLGLGIVVLIVIFLQAAFTAYQDYSSDKVMKSVQSMLPSSATVFRDGSWCPISAIDLVVGDLVKVKYGVKISADIRLIDVAEMRVDQSVLTGESEPVTMTTHSTSATYLESHNIALMGTLVTNGEGVGVVIATGDATVMGKIAKLSSTGTGKNGGMEQSLLQKDIALFVRIIASLAITTGVIIMVVWGAWLRRTYPTFISLSEVLVNTIGVIVAFVPDGLPFAITLTLTLVARRMASNKVLVKNLSTVETLGAVNVLASDKTGTLTQNKMVVKHIWMKGSSFTVGECGDLLQQHSGIQKFMTVTGLCNGAQFTQSETRDPAGERPVIGDATDIALLRASEQVIGIDKLHAQYSILHEIPFNSRNKWMLTLARANQGEAGEAQAPELFTKGAPDFLIGKCTHIMSHTGEVSPLDAESIQRLEKQQELWSSNGERVLLVCRKVVQEEKEIPVDWEDEFLVDRVRSGLCILGLVGIVDPPREETLNVVQVCRGAGIRLFMVTGDHGATAAAIAKQVGIFTYPELHTSAHIMNESGVTAFVNPHEAESTHTSDDDTSTRVESIEVGNRVAPLVTNFRKVSLLLTGSDLPNFIDSHWDRVFEYEEIVFSRTTPEQKLRIVEEFRSRGSVVGVTGDGVNDAPALKRAHIGIAMGGGSEVAVAAAHMVLLDNNFSSILVSLESGRLVFENLKKCLLYMLPAGSFAEMIPVLTNMFFGLPLPLSPFLMLVICVLTDVPPAIALVLEKPERDLLKRKPRDAKNDRLVNWRLLIHAYFMVGLIETLVGHILYFFFMTTQGGLRVSDLFFAFDKWQDGYHGKTGQELQELTYGGQSVMFISLVMCQAFGNLLSTRTRYLSFFQHNPLQRPTRNLGLVVAQALSLTFAIIVVHVPFFQEQFNTRAVPAGYWFAPLIGAVLIFLLDELRKFTCRSRPKGTLAKLAW
ncbi:calcium ATPase [Basidiobolus meristosporus CBS 931.73]|uniref:Calcium ATPase n=1 Tax=Basidiobolus meristosporus CBS 931.73 TaxID=1314790 RepID=A0A1Y1YK90_9FUNG|nr:calcium ATPase [Basidiobolus meristosporus CBS 931.73]|eukprot:ORX98166.1 calcium ATPase [Basidiobolus meristosporus CBS 931.73]